MRLSVALLLTLALGGCSGAPEPRPAFRVLERQASLILEAMLDQYSAERERALEEALATDADHVSIDLDRVQVAMEAAAKGTMLNVDALEERAGCSSIEMMVSTDQDAILGHARHERDEPAPAAGRVGVGVLYDLLDIPSEKKVGVLRQLSMNLWLIGDGCEQQGRIEDGFTTCVASAFCVPSGTL